MKLLQKRSFQKKNAIAGYEEIAEQLIQNGANVDAVGSRGKTALSWAAERGEKNDLNTH